MSQISTVLNAELLDSDSFSYRDIQRLCVRLKLGGKGKREVLVKKLQDWHRSRSPLKESPSVSNNDDLPMNVIGQRFCLLPINVVGEQTKIKNRGAPASNRNDENSINGEEESNSKIPTLKRRRSLVGGEGPLTETVSPRLLNPLVSKNDLLSPKSIVKSGVKKRKSLLFSPYNGVCIIPHRLDDEDEQ